MLKPSRMTDVGVWVARGLLLLVLALGLLVGSERPALAQAGGSSFDHSATGYPLLGQHENVRCETCHQRGIFKGTPRDCATCHARNNTRDALAMPVQHVVTTQTCDSCHTVNSFAGAIFSHVGVAPGGCTTCHNNISVKGKSLGHVSTNASCDQCHRTTAFLPAAVMPDNHIKVAPLSSCSDCHRGTSFAVMPLLANIHAFAQPGLGCADCHGAAAASFARPSAGFSVVGMPGNHIPTSAACELCHVGNGAGVASLPVGNDARFSGAMMSHTGISSGCATCHRPAGSPASFAGISSLVGQPPTSPPGPGSHIPTSAACEACHLASTPARAVPANASVSPPGTGFAVPAPSAAQIHAGVTSGCAACHETSMIWIGMGAYPMSPSVITTGAQYKGFQTRPVAGGGSNAVTDPAHPVGGDCSQCHGSTSAFTGIDRPANHIPFSINAACNSCHTSSDYAVMPTLANIHAYAPSSSTNCAQCHGAAAASFAIPAVGFGIVGLPANHIPTTASCETCHVGAGSSITALPVVDGAKFSGSLMNHAGISSNCVACHVPAGTASSFAGIARVVGMPPTSPAGASSHIPSSTTCETCHLASMPTGLIAATASKTAPGTAFATPTPTGTQIHSGVTAGCSACHETSMVWMGVSAYPISPSTMVPGASYKGFQTRPRSAAGTYNVADAAHPASGDCGQCHGNTTAFTAVDKPANHIPYGASAACDSCHTGTDFAVMPTLVNIHAYAPSSSTNCAQCHGAAAASFAIPAAGFSIVGLPANHLPTTASCEACHVGAGSSITALPVGNSAKFSGSLMNHAGITGNCVSCHVPAGTSSSFAGIARVVGMPPTSPAGASAHIPSSTSCETCHTASMPTVPVAASATLTAPGTAFATPAPTGAQIHTGITAGCTACHEASMVWMGVSAYPIAPSVMTPGAQYKGFQTRPRTAGGSYNVADPAHPGSGDCAQCHANTTAFTAIDKPANHIPYAATAQCSSCHTSGGDFAAMPTLANIHAYAPSTTSNCAQCHGAAAASYAIPAAGFSIVGLPADHIPTSASCETCHVGAGSSVPTLPVGNGAKFSGSLMNHAGISSNCVACHLVATDKTKFAGITTIVSMPATSPVGAGSHIPSSTACESCHLASLPVGAIAASASMFPPGTGFGKPAPTGVQIHNGVTTGCNGCHESSYVWMGVSAYPISPSTLTPGAAYKGFQTRPAPAAGAYNVADPAHPTSGDCGQCHASTSAFTGVEKPANHIPYATTAQCNSCHTSTDYKAPPTLANIHLYAPSSTGNCTQCHGAAAASFALPASSFSIVGLPANHVPTAASCEQCHVGAGSSIAALPVGNGAKFSGSLMSHAGIASNCEACHQPAGSTATFAGIARIVGMPPTSPAGAGSHIPSSTTCHTCHLASAPASLVAASATATAPGTGFATPAPSGVQIHSGVTSGCNACHEAGLVWMGVGAYPISPTVVTPGAQFHGFLTRPRAGGGTYSVTDAEHPTTRDCVECHSNTSYFTGPDKPANHIPYVVGTNCQSCHTSADYKVLPTLTNIHAYAPSTSSNCAQCHGAAAGSYAVPATGFAIVGLPGNHIPTTASCEVCHVGAGSSISALPVVDGAKFSASLMNHAGIGSNCVACHQPSGASTAFAGIARIVGMPPTSPAGASAHIPSSTTCETCHLATLPAGLIAASASKTAPGTAFATPAPSGAQIHSGVTAGCSACHETSMVWMGVSAYPISPSTLVPGALYNGFQTRPRSAAGPYNVADVAHPASGDCAQCHASTTAFTGVDKPANHIPYAATAQCSSCHTAADYAVMPTLANIHTYAPSTTSNCAQCHGAAATSFAIPAANFSIVGLPSNHIPTTAACELCHVGTGSSVTALPVGNGAKFSASQMNHAGIASNCVACHQPSGSSTAFAGITRIVGMPPTSPMGASAHIPSSTTCESCHLATTPAGMIPASASKTAPGTAFATPAPTGAQIHSGVTSGCATCHDTGSVWMGVGAYPIAPSTLSPGALYTGFQTRPRAAAGTYNVADPAHPAGGDCGQCHGNTTAFTGIDKPGNHIPYAASAACDSCHTSPDYAVMPSLANIHAYAPSTTSNCAQCHGAAAASFALPAVNFSIVGLPSNHIPTTASCEVCHVGAGSSITALPVSDGAKFGASLMNHVGISSNCVACHVPSGTSAAFVGIARIVGMPPTNPAGSGSHIPSSTACESCHIGSLPVGLTPASATKTAPGTAFATPAPTGVQIHTGVTAGCAACHEASMVWMGVGAYPISPSTLTAGASYTGFQTRPRSAASTYNVADAAHPSTGACEQCHAGTTAFTALDKPANHIPVAPAAQCSACHTGTDYSVMPTLAAIHQNAPSTTTNCAQCHGSAAASFAVPARNFSIVGLPANHIPTTAACELCHVGTGSSVPVLPVPNGAKFSGSLMSHAGITSNCAACHVPAGTTVNFIGVTRIVGMPPTSPTGATSHIPSSTVCENCHAITSVSGLIPASASKTAPGTLFTRQTTGAQIHNGVTSGCAACHDTGMVWMGMGAYPITPSVLTAGASYKGFQTRPRAAASATSVADAGHPAGGDCALCHTNTTAFVGVNPPANHIPYAASATCINCHTSSDYAAMPTVASIHAYAPSTTVNCAQCHGTAAASFAIPSANFSILGLPGNHIPTTASCEVCHVGTGSSVTVLPVPNGAKFSGSLMSHAGITGNCLACHVAAGTVTNFAGISRIVGMPPTSPVGVSSHIPSSTVCENCHSISSVTGLIPASATKTAPGTLFTKQTTGVQIHSGITSGCNACHDTGSVWMGMGAYPITPTTMTAGAQYHGFQSRPVAAASTYSVADGNHPASGDCSQCHLNTSYFDGAAKPAGHIPTTATCSTCHVKSGDFTITGLGTNAQLHTGITSNCRSCHAGGPYAGSGQVVASTLCATAALPYVPMPMPLTACGATPTTSSKLNHIPVGTQECNLCHGSANFTTFKMASTTAMKPKATTGPVPGTTMHQVGSPKPPFSCMSCHETGYTWFGVSIVTRPSGHNKGQDCDGSGCHRNDGTGKGMFAQVRAIPVRRAALNAALPHMLPRGLAPASEGAAAERFDHRGVTAGQCVSCHNGQIATGRPVKHYGNRLSCDSCHRSTAWRPAQFSHPANTAGLCANCHNGVDATPRPGNHFITVRACDSCHRPVAWTPVRYQHLSPAYQPQPDRTTCVSCHITNGEVIPRQLHGNTRVKPVPVTPGK